MPFRKADLTSNWNTFQFLYAATTNKNLMVSILVTGANVSE
jgi:hypothetical protein